MSSDNVFPEQFQYPDVLVQVPKGVLLNAWTKFTIMEKLQAAVNEVLPTIILYVDFESNSTDFGVSSMRFALGDEVVHVSRCSSDDIFVVSEISQEIVASELSAALATSKKRLSRCEIGLQLFKSRPPVLSKFVADLADLYGFVVETDLSFLMAADHFAVAAAANPGATSTFSFGAESTQGSIGPLIHHQRSTAELAVRFSQRGANAILRNRAVIIYLFELWESRYRGEISAAAGLRVPLASDFFGDLRVYRNKAAHGDAKLDRSTKVLHLVAVGESIDLVGKMHILFELAIAEINVIAANQFGVDAGFSLQSWSNTIPVAQMDSWSEVGRALKRD